MNTIMVPVSVGELIDKITILEIKAERITAPDKRHNVRVELEGLLPLWESLSAGSAELAGLLKALGARTTTIRHAFLAEAVLLSLAGAVSGFALGHAGAWSVRTAWPMLPAWPPDWAVAAALATALITGALFGVLPARRAARLDPVQALSKR